tara:strand:- start:418 stop:609 length:192 start_codon:yes stop_codon:yes gene_type:complete
MNASIKNALNKKNLGIRVVKQNFTFTIRDGRGDLDSITELATTKDIARAQAEAHLAGTSFTFE